MHDLWHLICAPVTLPMKLAYLPKTFDLPKGVEKILFSHLFNKKENENYIDQYLDAQFYPTDTMSK